MTIIEEVSKFLGKEVNQWDFEQHQLKLPEIIKLEIGLENGNTIHFILNNLNYVIDGKEKFRWAVLQEEGIYYINLDNDAVGLLPRNFNRSTIKETEYLNITSIKCLTKKDVSIDDLRIYYNYGDFPSNIFDDTDFFQLHFGLKPEQGKPGFLSEEQMNMKLGHLSEEFNEILKAYKERDIVEVADGLMDLIYVAAGLANLMNLPCHELWKDVQNSNIAYKERVTSLDNATKRGSTFDVRKTKDWIAPRGKEIIEAAIGRHENAEQD